uniref:PWI domain-containing protein n=1 Tax=Rhizophora mucronata TaxID=61149 RepID=A0A2P2LCE7_RHIMU
MGSVEDRTFRANFTEDGVAELRDAVTSKLKEFMGDYTDDTLVEYVIVLLRNGRRKEEARKELEVFLGDDSDSFVSWLWGHLATNLDRHVHPQEPSKDEAIIKLSLEEQAGRNGSHHIDSELEKDKPGTLSRSRHKREWKGLVRDGNEPPPLRSSDVDVSYVDGKPDHKVNHLQRSPSPQSPQQKKRRRHEQQQMKREEVSQATIDASRRLLQFAVKDAVATSQKSDSAKQSSMKRLRSVVSTSTGDSSLVGHPRRIRSIARVPNAMATVVKAVQEAAEDVMKVKSAGSVFDRLGRSVNIPEATELGVEYRDSSVEDEPDEISQIQHENHSRFLPRSEYRGHGQKMSKGESGTGLTSDSMSDNEGYDVHVMSNRVMNIGTSGGNRNENSLLQHSVAKNLADITQVAQKHGQDEHVSAANTSHKIVNISVNVNTWRPPQFPASKVLAEMDAQKSVVRLVKENSNPVAVGNRNVSTCMSGHFVPFIRVKHSS